MGGQPAPPETSDRPAEPVPAGPMVVRLVPRDPGAGTPVVVATWTCCDDQKVNKWSSKTCEGRSGSVACIRPRPEPNLEHEPWGCFKCGKVNIKIDDEPSPKCGTAECPVRQESVHDVDLLSWMCVCG